MTLSDEASEMEADKEFRKRFGVSVDTRKYALVVTIKYSTGREWFRTFGPFDKGYQARAFKNKIIRANLVEGYSQQWINENVHFQVSQFWELSK